MPDADLFLRPSGELRTSNFLLWQSAYAEFLPGTLFRISTVRPAGACPSCATRPEPVASPALICTRTGVHGRAVHAGGRAGCDPRLTPAEIRPPGGALGAQRNSPPNA